MLRTGGVRITDRLSVPVTELDYRASRSGGPGGQHVNTSSTRVELWWDVTGSPSLTPEERDRLLRRLASRLDTSGRLRVVSSGTRSQLRNREQATERFAALVAAALVVPKRRKKTRPSPAAKERRLQEKKQRSRKKAERRRRPDD